MPLRVKPRDMPKSGPEIGGLHASLALDAVTWTMTHAVNALPLWRLAIAGAALYGGDCTLSDKATHWSFHMILVHTHIAHTTDIDRLVEQLSSTAAVQEHTRTNRLRHATGLSPCPRDRHSAETHSAARHRARRQRLYHRGLLG